MKERIKDIISYSDMIGSLVKKDLRGKYKGSVLGFLWTFINPLCQIIVYTIVFSVIVRSNLDKPAYRRHKASTEKRSNNENL